MERSTISAAATSTTITPSHPSLSTHDTSVLQALFDAEPAPTTIASGTTAVTVDASLPPLPDIPATELAQIQAREIAAIRAVQEKTTRTALAIPSLNSNSGRSVRENKEAHAAIEAAIADLDALIVEYPTYPSAYVNRAQARRMVLQLDEDNGNEKARRSISVILDAEQNEGKLQQPPQPTITTTEILTDLNQAIHLASSPSSSSSPSPLTSSTTSTISPLRARILADAHTHRGYLLLQASKSSSDGGDDKNPSSDEAKRLRWPETLRHLGKDDLEEMASRDFFLAGHYGNPVAKVLAVQTNPYARMCGAIVKEALRKEIQGV
jgi:hypothetical protein